MKVIVAIAILLGAMSGDAFAAKLKLKGIHGPIVAGSPYTGVVNDGTINGGSGTGLTVTGTASQSVTNNGTITGSTGISVSGGSSTIVNTGTIYATSTGGKAVGISSTN